MSPRRTMKLGAFLHVTGHHVAAWRHPGSQPDAGVNLGHYVRLARTAERARFDMVFLADSVAASTYGGQDAGRQAKIAHFEPLTLLSALAAVTTHIGLVATATTTHLAREFASLDHISGGRAGWNLVTSANPDEAFNFGLDAHVPHAERYDRALQRALREFVQVVRGLWDSWEDDAFPRDPASGVFFHPGKLHVLNHEGRHFRVRGPLNVPRSPQGHPVVVQAGSSEPGKALAAETAEVVFTAHQTMADAQEFYADVKGRVAAFGRDPDDLKIMPGIFPVVGRTEQEAADRFGALQELIHPDVGLGLLSKLIGFDLSGHPVDGPLPEMPESNAGRSRAELLVALARRDGLSIRQLYLRIAGARGHRQIQGTPSQIADQLEEWFAAGAADGFNVMPPTLPEGLDDFAALVIPELQRRGLFRREYEGRTLRENLGLRRPPNRLARRGAAAPLAAAAAE